MTRMCYLTLRKYNFLINGKLFPSKHCRRHQMSSVVNQPRWEAPKMSWINFFLLRNQELQVKVFHKHTIIYLTIHVSKCPTNRQRRVKLIPKIYISHSPIKLNEKRKERRRQKKLVNTAMPKDSRIDATRTDCGNCVN